MPYLLEPGYGSITFTEASYLSMSRLLEQAMC